MVQRLIYQAQQIWKPLYHKYHRILKRKVKGSRFSWKKDEDGSKGQRWVCILLGVKKQVT